MEHDITNSVFEKRDPWDLFDHYFGKVRNFFAAVGVVAMVAFLFGVLTK